MHVSNTSIIVVRDVNETRLELLSLWCWHLANNMALNQGFLGHIKLDQCRKCYYSLKRTQNFRLFNFVRQAVSEQHGLGGGLRAMTAF